MNTALRRTAGEPAGQAGGLSASLSFLAGTAAFAGLFAVSRHNYLMFHGLAEMFSIVVACSVFLLVWNARAFVRNDALIFLGIAYLYVGMIDGIHTLAYRGMGFLPDAGASNVATQLWIAARGLEALGLFLFPLLIGRRVRPWLTLCGFGCIAALLVTAILFWRLFPSCYVDGVGLTPFKKGAEYAICFVLVLTTALLSRKRERLDPAVYRMMIAAVLLTIAAELMFTLYVSVYGLSNLLGHYLKLVSFLFVYAGLIRSGLTRPYSTLFRELEQERASASQREQRLRILFDDSADAMYVCRRDGQLLQVNRQACRATGYTEQELLGLNVTDLDADTRTPEALEAILERVLPDSACTVESRHRRKDGTVFPVEITLAHTEISGESCFLGIARDITERKQADEEREITLHLLRAVNRPNGLHDFMSDVTQLMRDWSGCEAVGIRLQVGEDFPYFETRGFPSEFVQAENALCEVGPDGELVRDPQGNPVLECMCGNVIRGRFDPSLPFFTATGSFWTNSTSDLLASTTEEDRQARTRNRCHGEGYESVALIPLRYGGETLGLIQFNDTRRDRFDEAGIALFERLAANLALGLVQRRSAAALRENEAFTTGLLRNAPHPIVVINPDTSIRYVNPAFTTLTGFTSAETFGTKAPYPWWTPETLDKTNREFTAALAEGALRVEEEFRRKDGSRFWVEITSATITADAGQKRYLANWVDITDRKHAARALEESEARYRGLYAHAPIGIFRTNSKGQAVALNSTMARILGADSPEEALQYYHDLGAQLYVDSERRNQFLAEIREKGFVEEFDYEARTMDGRRIWLSMNARVAGPEEGGDFVIEGFTTDITERKQTAEALRRSEEKFRLIAESSVEDVWQLDRSGLLTYVSPAAYRVFGYTPEEAEGLHFGDFIDESEHEQASGAFAKALAGEQYQLLELIGKRKDGSTFPLEVAITPILKDRAAIGVQGVARDITERKQAEEALRASEEKFRTVFKQAAVGVAQVTPEGRFSNVNERLCEILGYTKDELCAMTFREVTHPDDLHLDDAEIARVVAGEADSFEIEKRYIHKQGQPVWVRLYSNVVRDEKGAIDYAIAVIVDITERKEAEQALRESETRVRTKLDALLSPEGDFGALELADVIDAKALQAIMDRFYDLTGIGVGIVDQQGKVLVATGWQDICTRFHRCHPETARNCIESDTKLSQDVAPGQFKVYRCKNGMYDIATPFMIGGRHIGNLFLGQFFYDDEPPDREAFRAQAQRYGFDQDAYLEALGRVPHWSPETVEHVMRFYARFAEFTAHLSFANLKLARALEQQRLSEEALSSERERLGYILRGTNAGTWEWNVQTGEVVFNERWADMVGYTLEEIAPVSIDTWRRLCHPEDLRESDRLLQACFSGESEYYHCECRMHHKDGEWVWVLDRGKVSTWTGDGKPEWMYGTHQDITDQKRGEEALRASEQRFREMADLLPQVIWEADREGRFTYVNQAAKMIFGWDEKDLEAGLAVGDVVAPEDRERVFLNFTKARQGDERVGGNEYVCMKKDGTRFTVLIYSEPIIRNGMPAGLRGITIDITVRKQIEEALRESEVKYRILAENALQGVVIARRSPIRLAYANPAMIRLLGYSVEELMGMEPETLRSLVWEGDRQRFFETFQKRLKSEDVPRESEYRLISKDGSIKWVAAYSSLIEYLGEPAALTSFVDITARKRAEDALRESEERFRSIAEQTSDLISLTDSNGFITYASSASRELFRADPEEMCGRHFTEFLDEAVMPTATAAFGRVMQDGEPCSNIELTMRRKDGSTFIGELSGSHFDCGAFTGSLVVIRDITDRKEAEEEQAHLEEQLRQAQKMESVGRLAGGVAHDFNNMLGVILGHADVVLEELEASHPLHDSIAEIHKAGQRSADLTRQLLAFARRQTVSPKVLDLNETVAGMLRMLERLIGEDIELHWQPGADLWPVRMDPSQIDQMLANLCVNARDAIDGIGTVTIQTCNTRLEEADCAAHPHLVPGEYVQLSITDSGAGMDQETVKRIFEPFFTTKPLGEGTGLGLATVYGIVKQNDGFIYVYSEPGEGTVFHIYLPQHVGKREQIVRATPSDTNAQGHGTVLVVEDEPSMLGLTKAILQRLGYDVLAAATPGEAIAVAEGHPGAIDVLLTDVIMPEMNGRELAKRLLPLYPGMKCVFMSGYTADIIAHHGIMDGKVHFLQKPFVKKTLAATMRDVFEEPSPDEATDP